MLLSAVTAAPFTAPAQDMHNEVKFTVEVSGNTFTVKRNNTSNAQTVRYRTVSGLALAGVHFREATGTLTFAAGDNSESVTVTEYPVADLPVADRYQIYNNIRNYYLEVFNDIGQVIARGERVISGYNANFTYYNRMFKGGAFSTTVRLADASRSSSDEPQAFDNDSTSSTTNIRSYTKDISVRSQATTVTDAGYNQAVYTVSTQPFLDFVGAAQEYLAATDAKFYLKTFLRLHEISDGYQYIQILVDNPNGCDTGAGDGNPGTVSASAYMCGFEHYSGNADPAWTYQSFPYRTSNDGKYECYSDKYSFVSQKVNSRYSIDSLSAALVIPASAQQLSFRLNASGSQNDDWEFENLKVRGIVVDKSAPTIKNIVVAPGDYRIGQTLSISVEFNEIINRAPSGIVTNFGTLSSYGSTGTNVINYKGQISGTPGSNLTITGFESGSFEDLVGNSSTPSFSHTVNNVRLLDNFTPQLVNGKYMITNVSELYKFIEIANTDPTANAVLMSDINVNPMRTSEITLPKLGTLSNGYLGTFDGNGHSISGLVSNGGLVAKLGTTGKIKDLSLTVIRAMVSGSASGVVCTDNSGTIERVSVNADYTTATNVSNNQSYIGIISGTNNGTISDCLVSGAYLFSKGNSVGAMPGICGFAGINNGTVENSCFAGSFSVGTSYNGHNATICVKNNSGGVINNCYGVYTDSANYETVYNNSGALTDSAKVTEAQLASGEVAYNLSGGVTDGTQIWYQTIGTDSYPVYSGATVYKHGNIYTNNNAHILEHIAAVPATCTETGVQEHWQCTIDGCGKLFSDADAENETTAEALIIPVLLHSWTTAWSYDGENHWKECTLCGAINEEAAHTFAVQYTWEADNSSVTAHAQCSVCSQETTEVADTEITSATATCTEAGTATYTATFENPAFTAQSKTVAAAAFGHSYYTVVTEPTCTEGGYTTYICDRCGESYTGDYTSALGHDWGEPEWEWNGEESATATFTCANDSSHTETLDAQITEEDGVLTATVTLNGATYTNIYGSWLYPGYNEVYYSYEGNLYSFIAPTDGYYHFYSTVPGSDADPRIYIYDGETQIAYNDDGDDGVNFDCSVYLSGGRYYKVKLRTWGSYFTGYVTIQKIALTPLIESSSNIVDFGFDEIPAYSFTPSTDGWYRIFSVFGMPSDSSYISVYKEGKEIRKEMGEDFNGEDTMQVYMEGGKEYALQFWNGFSASYDIIIDKINELYSVTVPQSTPGGSVELTLHTENGNAPTGPIPEETKVYIHADPDYLYNLSSLTVTDSNNNSISVNIYENYFYMPQANVIVSAEFSHYPWLSMGENTLTLVPGNSNAHAFTPQVSGYYRFYSDTSDVDPEIDIYSIDAHIGNQDDIDVSTNRNFDLTVLLEAGVTYDVRVYNYYSSSTADVPVFVESVEAPDADKSALLAALEKAGEYSAEDYSAASFDELQAVIAQYEDYPGQLLTQQMADEATAAILTAISNLVPYLNLTVASAHGTFEVNELGQEESTSFLFGEGVSLTAYNDIGYDFVCWFDTVSKRIVSTSPDYSFTMTSNTSLEAIYKAVDSGVLVFMTDDGFVAGMVEKTSVEWEFVTDFEELAPPLPYRLGATEGEWLVEPSSCKPLLMEGCVVYAYANYNYPDGYTTHDIQEPSDSEPALDLYYELDSENNVGSFIMTAGIPDDIEVESIGIAFYYKKANLFNPENFDLTINNKILTSKFEASTEDGRYIVDVKNFTDKYNWAARGYVTYYDNGELKVAYTNQINIVDRVYVNDPNIFDIDFPGKPVPGIPGWNDRW